MISFEPTTLVNSAGAAAYAPVFGGLEEEFSNFDSAEVTVLPVPYDKTSTYNKGADRGPQALLQASTQVELYDIETETEVFLRGISTLAPLVVDGPPEDLFACIKQATSWILGERKFPVVIGGEHSITPGVVAAFSEQYKNLSVLQFDAHGDTRESYHGSKYNHACAMARVREYCPYVGVGIRAIDASEVASIDRKRMFYAYEVHTHTPASLAAAVSAVLTPEVYITIDLDCFDSAIMPSTGTPEPGGLNWTQVMTVLRHVCKHHRVVGFDVVELLPRKEDPAPDFLAAKLVYQLLSYVFSSR